jgi:hypothetical protein
VGFRRVPHCRGRGAQFPPKYAPGTLRSPLPRAMRDGIHAQRRPLPPKKSRGIRWCSPRRETLCIGHGIDRTVHWHGDGGGQMGPAMLPMLPYLCPACMHACPHMCGIRRRAATWELAAGGHLNHTHALPCTPFTMGIPKGQPNPKASNLADLGFPYVMAGSGVCATIVGPYLVGGCTAHDACTA